MKTVDGEDQRTLADHAEEWTREQGREVPPRDTPEWRAMYEQWHAYAFQDFQTCNDETEDDKAHQADGSAVIEGEGFKRR
jgi:hypothetical protein